MELPSLSRHTAILQTGLWMTSLLKVTPLPLRSVMRRSRSSISNAIVPPAEVAGLFLGEVKTAAARQVVFHPPVVALVAGRARLEAERLLVEFARPRHVSDRVICEGDFLEHGTPFLATRSAAASRLNYTIRLIAPADARSAPPAQAAAEAECLSQIGRA